MAIKILPDQAHLLQCFDYQPETGLLTWKHRPREHFADDVRYRRWNTKYAGKEAGFLNKDNAGPRRFAVGLDGMAYGVPRIIWKIMTGVDPVEVDHRDRNPQNNTWSNLREARKIENCRNRWCGNKTGLPKGVQRHRDRPTFYATIFANGRANFLGVFTTAELAAAAYREAANRLHGEFAHTGE